ncbi:MAG: hypothetical protein M3Y41_06485 [Pseudomonadota bacterium]|nr:hypothetical protein [Pseudomonadota bacterium]
MEKDKPRVGTKAEAGRAERQAREAAALRENLHRRKEQARTRESGIRESGKESTVKDSGPCP